jgi:hypothetical protein
MFIVTAARANIPAKMGFAHYFGKNGGCPEH